MDRTGITVVTICAILLGVWFFYTQKYGAQVAQQRALNTNAVAQAQATATAPTPAAPAAPGFSLETNVPERVLTVTNANARYTFTSRGGGIKTVELLHYPETITPRWKRGTGANALATLNAGAPAPILAILGAPGLIGDGDFSLTKIKDGVEAEKSLPNGLVVTKDFHLSSNYLVTVNVTLKNDSGKPLPLPAQNWIVGTATPMDVDDSSFPSYGGAMWYDGSDSHLVSVSYFNPSTTVLLFFPRTPKTEYNGGNDNAIWGAAYNQFFVMLAMPRTNQPAEEFAVRPADLGTKYQGSPWSMGNEAALVYPAQTLVADQVLERQVVLYDGPKEFRTLDVIGNDLQNHAELAMNFGTGFASFWGIGSFFAKVLLFAMNGLHDLIPKISYGWIIVLLTILLRAFFWPFTAASMRSMKKMQALAPEVKALKEKYKDEPQKFTQKQMELWRKNKVSPMSGCLPMLIQMPVFLGFFTMIRSAIELRGAHFLWVADLTKPDTLFVIPGINFPFNLLPLLMVGVMVVQAHLQPPSPGMDPSQQKMIRYMPLFFLLFLYNYSAGMALYMTVSTTAGIVQTRLIKNIPPPAVSPLTPPQKKKK